jgi:hypothetical protein
MDYGYDKAKEDDLEERRLRHKPQPTLEQQREEDRKEMTELKALAEQHLTKARKPHVKLFLLATIKFCEQDLKSLNQ